MYQNPKRAKKLYFDVIPRSVDEYLNLASSYVEGDMENPVFYIHYGQVPKIQTSEITFTMLLNLAIASNSNSKELLWRFVEQHAIDFNKDTYALIDELVGKAVQYYNDFTLPKKQYKIPSEIEQAALKALEIALEKTPENSDAQYIQHLVYIVGKENGYEDNIKDWFTSLYQILLGQNSGPKIGSFIMFYGIAKTIDLIRKSLSY
jgi:lysyl-tRNA synthetase class 1